MNISEALEILEPTKWTKPDSYMGHSPDGDYCIYSIHRDSTELENSNMDVIKETFKDSLELDVFSASHWAVGWVEYFIVPANSSESDLIRAAKILASLEQYPVLDESHYSELQHNKIGEYWENMSISDRFEEAERDIEEGLNVFSLRHSIPEHAYDNLMELFY